MAEKNETVELHFPLVGVELPSDHAYSLFGALSKIVPAIHDADWLGIHNIVGLWSSQPGVMYLTRDSKLRLRLPFAHIQSVYEVAGKSLDVGGYRVECGAPTILGMRPSSRLRARAVVLKPADSKGPITSEAFLACFQRQIDALGVKGSVELEVDEDPPNDVTRRIVRIAGAALVGYTPMVSGLGDEDSLLLQTKGIGGRRKFGCGLFLPMS